MALATLDLNRKCGLVRGDNMTLPKKRPLVDGDSEELDEELRVARKQGWYCVLLHKTANSPPLSHGRHSGSDSSSVSK
jgi:hypothetical protein